MPIAVFPKVDKVGVGGCWCWCCVGVGVGVGVDELVPVA